MRTRFPLFLICLLLLSTLATAFHHHDDGEDHPDCSICAAAHQQADTGFTAPVCHMPRGSELPSPPPVPVLRYVARPFLSPLNDRAPPA